MADPSYPEFVERRLSLAIKPVRDIRVPLTGAEPFILAPVTQVLFYKTQDTDIEDIHETTWNLANIVRSLQPPGFLGSTYGVSLEDITLGVYFAGWRSIEVRCEMETPCLCKLIL